MLGKNLSKNISLKIVGVIIFSLIFFALSSNKVLADQTWDGGGGADTNWNTCTNWTTNTCPLTTDIAIFNGTSSNNSTISSNIDVKGISIDTGYGGTITQSNTFTVTLGTSGYSQAVGTFVGGNSTITVSGAFIISGGSFTSTSNTLSILGNYSNAGTFTHNSGTVLMNSTSTGKTLSGNMITTSKFFNLTFNGIGGAWSFGANPTTVAFGFVITAGIVTAPSTTLSIGDVFTNNGTFVHNSGTVIMTCIDTTFLSGSMIGLSSFYNLTFNNLSGQWRFTTYPATVVNDFTITAGTVEAPSTTLTITGNYSNAGTFFHNSGTVLMTATSGGKTLTTDGAFYNLTFDGIGGAWAFSANPTGILNNFTIINGTVTAPNDIMNIGGSYSNAGTFTNNSGSVIMNSTTGGKTLSGTMTTTSSFYNLYFDGTGGAWSFGVNSATVANDFTIFNGTVTAPSTTLTITGNFASTGTFTHNSGTVLMNATDAGNTLTENAFSSEYFYNLTFNGVGGAWAFSGLDYLYVANDFTITAGTFTSTLGPLTITGNYSNSGTFIHNNGNVIMNATTTGKILTGAMTSTSKFKHLTFNGVGGAWSFGSNTAEVEYNLTITNGTVTAPSTSLTVGWNYSNSGVFTNNSGTFVVGAFGNTARTLAGTMTGSSSFYNLTFTTTSGTVSFGANAATILNNFTSADPNTTVGLPTSATLTVGGNYAVKSITAPTSGTVLLNATTTGHTVSDFQSQFYNLTFDGVGGAWAFIGTYNTSARNAVIRNDFTIVNGTVTSPPTPSSIKIAGNYSNSGTFTHNSGSVVMTSTTTGKTLGGTMTTTSSFYNLTFNGSGGAWSFAANPATIANNFTITLGTVTAPSTTLNVGNNYSNAGIFTHNSGTVLMNATDAGNTLSGTMTTTSQFYNLTFNGSGGAWTFGANSAGVANDFTITLGTVTAPSTTLTITDNYSNSGTFTHNSGIVLMNAIDAGNTLSETMTTTSSFYDLFFNGGGAWTFATNSATVAHDFTIFNGAVTAPSSTLSVGNNFSDLGSFVHNSGSVILTGGNQSISGNTTFFNLTKTVTSSSTLTYDADANVTVLGLWTMRGAPGNLLSLHSSSSPTKWIINPAGSKDIAYLSVMDSSNVNATAISVVGLYITNGGNNLNWSFGELPHIPFNLAPASLNSGSWTTDNTPTITFDLSVNDGPDLKYTIEIDNNSDFSSPEVSNTSSLSINKSRTFDSTTISDGMYYFRIKTLDPSNVESAWVVSNSGQVAFKIDTTAPSVPGTPLTATPTANSLPTWSWTVSTDGGSGLASPGYLVQWCLSNDFTGCGANTSSVTTNSFLHTSGLTAGTWYFRVKSLDLVGNESAFSSLGSAVISPTAPVGTISINSNDVYTTSNSVTLIITGTDSFDSFSALQMMLSSNPDFSGVSYQFVNSIVSWNFENTNGVKTVYMKLKNSLGTESSVFSDSIIYDILAPTDLSYISPLNSTTNFIRPVFKWHVGVDNVSNVAKYIFTLTYTDNTTLTLDNLESFITASPSSFDHAKYTISKSGDFISLKLKDSNLWSSVESRGRLKPGLISVKVQAFDAVGNIAKSEGSFTFVQISPKITLNSIDKNVDLNIQADSSSSSYSTTNLNPLFSGSIGSGEYTNVTVTASKADSVSMTCNVSSSTDWQCKLNNSLSFGMWDIKVTATNSSGVVESLPTIYLNVVAEKVDSSIVTTTSGGTDVTSLSSVNLADGYTIELTILDDNNNPLVGAKVTIPGDPTVYVTDKNGKISIKKIKEGEQKIFVEYQGKTTEQIIQVLGTSEVITKSISIKLNNTDTGYRAVIIVTGILLLVIAIIVGRKLYLKSKSKKEEPVKTEPLPDLPTI